MNSHAMNEYSMQKYASSVERRMHRNPVYSTILLLARISIMFDLDAIGVDISWLPRVLEKD